MIVKLFWQLVLDYLLEDYNEGRSQVSVLSGVLLHLFQVEDQGSRHNTGLPITKRLLHLLLVLANIPPLHLFLKISTNLQSSAGRAQPSS